MIKNINDTIIAIATPMGEGAISVIRVSGEVAIEKVSGCFIGKQNLATAKSHTAHFGRIIDSNGKILDEVVCTVFHAPNSFTGENTIEISCHGGIHVTRRVLECILETGTRPAKPGEFTQRAFLNGKLDLSQAEAIADLIQSQSDKAHKTSINQLEGILSKQIRSVREQLMQSLGLLELELDFVEEDIEFINKQKIEELVKNSIIEIEKLVSTYKYGKVWREGVRAVLVGSPNAGKSSLLNALLNENRAIVTDIPGTTRDFIEEKMIIAGVLFRMVDTAGLRETSNPIENEGVKRTWQIAENADIIILVHDSTKSLDKNELGFIEKIGESKKLIIVNNKIDLVEEIYDLKLPKDYPVVETSAVTNAGMDNLKDALTKQVLDKTPLEEKESVTITNERHYSALIKAKESLALSFESLKAGKSGEFVAVDLRMAIDSIGEIIGLVTTEDILNNIFSKFCIGK